MKRLIVEIPDALYEKLEEDAEKECQPLHEYVRSMFVTYAYGKRKKVSREEAGQILGDDDF